jgi:acetyl esterase/lipase
MNTLRIREIVRFALCIGLSAVAMAASAQQVIPVWPGAAPGSENWTQKEVEYLNPQKQRMVRNVVTPTLTAFLPAPASATGTAVIVCPGGGFHFLSWDSEGVEAAKWLSAHGVAAFVLKYRLVNTGATEEAFRQKMAAFFSAVMNRGSRSAAGGAASVPMTDEMKTVRTLAIADGRQAVKVVRQRAAEWGVAPDRIGLLGFSAGAMVTLGVALAHDVESRPNFAAPIYGTDTEGAPVPADAPPLFILCASDDPLLPPAGSARLYIAWKAAGKPAELHIYAQGGHGFGMNKRGLPIDHWIERFGDWLEAQGLLKPAR